MSETQQNSSPRKSSTPKVKGEKPAPKAKAEKPAKEVTAAPAPIQEETNMSNATAETNTNTAAPVQAETETPTPAKRGPGRPRKTDTENAAPAALGEQETKGKRKYTRRNPELAAAAARKNMTADEILKIPAKELASEFETLTAEKEKITARLAEIRETVALAMDENEIQQTTVQAESGTTFNLTRRMSVRVTFDKPALTLAMGEEFVNKYTKKQSVAEMRFDPVRQK